MRKILFFLIVFSAWLHIGRTAEQDALLASTADDGGKKGGLAKPQPPFKVGVPPADAGRGLVRVSEREIRAYPGKGGTHYLQSQDNGMTWRKVALPPSYPDATCMAKEAPSLVRNPNTGAYLRVEPKYSSKNKMDGLYVSRGGLDGEWGLVRGDDGKGLKPAGILRTPIWVNGGKRVLIPGHGGGCWTWYSDDGGLSWNRSNKVNSPPHEAGGIHHGRRWNHGMVEGTLVELNDGRLWMVARTAQDQHYETFSDDFGETWSPAKPSRFYGTITMPTFHRLEDGRLLFFWSNTTPLPEVKRLKKRGGEDVFTNRDALHAAISEDDGQTWIGFREVVLDEHRNDSDYAVTPGSNDRGKHQCEVIQLDNNRVLFSTGQHPLHRKLMVMDVRWLYEKERYSDLRTDGTRDWSTHQYINKIVGHCGYNRTPGARVESGALRVLRGNDTSLTNPNQGATWNFPAGKSGKVTFGIQLESNESKARVCLADRWFNPTDETVPMFAQYSVELGEKLLKPGKVHSVGIQWEDGGNAKLFMDGKPTDLRLPPQSDPSPNGISYIHFYNPTEDADGMGFRLFSTTAKIQ